MTEKAYNLIEIFLKFSLWPLLAIIALIIFRSQIRAILSNIGGANNVKLNSAVLSFEATTTQSTIAVQESDERTDIVESAQNTKKTSSLKATGNDWFIDIYDLLTDGKSDEAQEAFDNFIRIKGDSINYAKEHSFFLYLKYEHTLNSDISNQILVSIEQSNEPEKNNSILMLIYHVYKSPNSTEKQLHFWKKYRTCFFSKKQSTSSHTPFSNSI